MFSEETIHASERVQTFLEVEKQSPVGVVLKVRVAWGIIVEMQHRRHVDIIWAGKLLRRVYNLLDEPDEGTPQLWDTLESPPVVADKLGCRDIARQDRKATIHDYSAIMCRQRGFGSHEL
jgi:hypothetical protein